MSSTKTLIIVRHGHAIRGDDDFERTLSPRGFDEARHAGEALQARGTRLDHVLSSSAPRAYATAEVIAPYCNFDKTIERSQSLYLATPRGLFSALWQLDDAIGSLLLVGHNPGLSNFVEQLTGERTNLGTAEVRYVTLAVQSWSLVTA